MKKNKKKLIDVLYALCFEFIAVPIMGFVTYSIYDRFFYTSTVHNNLFFASALIFVLVLANIVALYGIAYLFNKVYKMNLITYIVTGLITLFVGIWVEVYFYAVSKTNCLANSNLDCLGAVKDYNSFTVALIMAVSYYLIYIVLHKMIEKKLSISKKG